MFQIHYDNKCLGQEQNDDKETKTATQLCYAAVASGEFEGTEDLSFLLLQ